jgi:hypothetical protein
MTQTQKSDHYITSGNKVVDGIFHNLEWIIGPGRDAGLYYLCHAGHRIPTGSMAETSAAIILSCAQWCGYRYDYDFLGHRFTASRIYCPNRMSMVPSMPRCPSCGFYEEHGHAKSADQRYKNYL